MKLVWTRHAQQRRMQIIRYIARANPDAARRMATLIKEAVSGLLSFPCKGRIGRFPGTRELVFHSHYILVYTVDGDTVRIVALLHTSQLYPPVD